MTDRLLECILLPFAGVNYLLPLLCVAEIIPYRKKVASTIDWHADSLPVTTLDGKQPSDHIIASHLAIIHGEAGGYYAACLDEPPLAIKVNADEIEWLEQDKQTVRLKSVTGKQLDTIMIGRILNINSLS